MRKSGVVKRPVVLLVAGIGHGCGVTHTALSLANFYASYQRRKVCYFELSEGGISGLYDLQNRQNKKQNSRTHISSILPGFELAGIRFLPGADHCALTEFLGAMGSERRPETEMVICDLSGNVRDLEAAISLADLLVFVLGLRPWRSAKVFDGFSQLYSRKETDISQGVYCGFSVSKAERKRFVSRFDTKVLTVPYIDDPFRLKYDDIRFLKRLVSLLQVKV